MSNSIWKTPDQKPEENEDIVFIYGSSPITGYYKKNDDTYVEHIGGETFYDNEVERWAYVADIIARADKAERLQKEITQELDIYYSPNPSLHPADDCIYAIEKIIGYKRPKETTNDK